MKKLGLCACYNHKNYGSQLQSYALKLCWKEIFGRKKNTTFRKNFGLYLEKGASIKIGNNCWICTNAVILKGVEIGDNSVIGAGCVIYRDIPANSVVKSNGGITIESLD